MASTVTLTGRIVLPGDAAPDSAQIRLQLTGTDTDQITREALPAGGQIVIDLDDGDVPAGTVIWRNTAGLAGSSYNIYLTYTDADGRGQSRLLADRRTVGDEDSYDLSDLIDAGVAAAAGTYVRAITAAQYNAAITARDEAQGYSLAAEASAARVDLGALDQAVEDSEVARDKSQDWAEGDGTPGGPGTKSAKGHSADAAAQVVLAAAEADRAEDAQVAAQSAVLTDYRVATTADLDDLTPTTGQTAWVSDTGHFWHWDGAAWVDDGLGMLSDFRYVFDLLGFQGDDDLIAFTDDQDQIVGRVRKDATWDIALAVLATADFELASYEVNDPAAAPLYVLDADGYILFAAPPPGGDTSAEVIAARGTAADLGSRLDTSLSPSGVIRAPRFGRETMRNCHYKLVKRRLSEAVQVNIAAIGDSYTQAAIRWTGPAAQLLMAAYGDGGGGWTGYGWYGGAGGPWVYPGTQPAGINGNVRPAVYPVYFSGAWATVYNASDSPDLAHVTSSSAGAYIRREVPASPDHTALRVVFVGTADGVVRHRVDGGGWTSQNVQGTVDAIQTFDITLTPGAHVIEIEVVSGTVKLCGDNALSAASGVRFHKLGGSGSNIGQWTARNEARQRAGWEALEVDTFVILDGTNSQVSMAPAIWAGHLETLIARLRAAAAVPDILVMVPPDNMRANTYAMPLYAAAGREVAAAQGTAFVDLQRDFGLATADYASTSDRPLFNADGIHPEPDTGGRVIAAALLDMIEA